MQHLIVAHVEFIRSFTQFSNAWIIGVFESNLGHESSHIEFMLRPYQKIFVIREKDRIGVHTTANRKELYAMATTRFFSQNAIHFWESFSASNPNAGDSLCEAKRVKKEFQKQLFMFKRIIVRPMRGFSLPRIVYSGKIKGANDDIVITLTMLLYWAQEFICHRTSAPMEMFLKDS